MMNKNIRILGFLVVGLCQAGNLKELYSQVSAMLDTSKQQLESVNIDAGIGDNIDPIKKVIAELCAVVPVTLILGAKEAMQALGAAQKQAAGQAEGDSARLKAEIEEKKQKLETDLKRRQTELRNAVLGNISTAVQQLIAKIQEKLDAVIAAPDQKSLVENRDQYAGYVATIVDVLNGINVVVSTKEIAQLIKDIEQQKDMLASVRLVTKKDAAEGVKRQFKSILQYFNNTAPRSNP